MNNFSKYMISEDCSILDALKALNNLSSDSMTLFVVNNNKRIIGTLTDGDIRRALINGFSLNNSLEKVMHTNFSFISSNEKDITKKVKLLKEKDIKLVPLVDDNSHIIDVYNLNKYQSILPIDAIIMAGGKGERLRPLTEKKPKPLLLVGDKAIIDHNVDRLISYGVKHISVTVNYLKEQIEEHYQKPRQDIKVNCFRETKFLGTIGSVKLIDVLYNDDILVMNSDLFTNINYEDFYLHYKEYDADMSVAAVPYNISIPYGILDMEGLDIKGLVEKPVYNYYANAGIYLIKKSALDETPDDTFFNATDLIERLIIKGKKVIRFPLNGTWIDIGNYHEYQKANDLVKHIK